ncbi:MAG: hypothetical protein HYR56_14325 [Acidobacteria bacterium]|nr:hypothetical protein [Acidobacteriota bacterium]MBI3422328.1 hypothetical protein [Acidobacteriota bacterium]
MLHINHRRFTCQAHVVFILLTVLIPFDVLAQSPAEQMLASRARSALRAFKYRDASTLAALTHPTKGVRFSPYGHVLVERERRLTRQQVARLFTDRRCNAWGEDDVTGETIKLNGLQYVARRVYDRDFLRAPQVFYNQVVFGGTTMPNNVAEVYPRAVFMTFHFSNTEETGAQDWTSLCLGFEEHDGKWYLVAVIHNVWTI